MLDLVNIVGMALIDVLGSSLMQIAYVNIVRSCVTSSCITAVNESSRSTLDNYCI